MTRLHVDFRAGVGAHWRTCALHGSRLERTAHTLRLVNVNATAERYTNAQIDDYRGLPRRRFLWLPPLTLTVRARFSHRGAQEDTATDPGLAPQASETEGGPPALARAQPPLPAISQSPGAPDVLLGTAGFGFWNDPFMLTEKRLPTLPRAIWFFYASPPSDMRLDLHTAGWGWKAATIDAARLPFLLLAPTIPIAVPLMHSTSAYRRLWPIGQRAIGVSEAPLRLAMTDWHTYVIEWGVTRARFLVDGEMVLDCTTPPKGPLGLVLWIDNQFMVVTPQGRLRHGLLAKPSPQWLELATVTVT